MNSKQNYPHLGRQKKTSDTYATKGKRLAERLADEAGSTDSAVVVAKFISSTSRFTQRTFRLYKAQLLEHLARSNAPPGVLKTLSDASSKECVKRGGPGTSGAKAKKVSGEDQALLLETLRASGSATAQLAADYFEAGLLIGPRPMEWVGASIKVIARNPPIDAPATATHVLQLINAKRDLNGVRGNGDVRTIYATLSVNEAAVIARVIGDATQHEHTWQKHYNAVRAALRYAGKKLWPRRSKVPCFYTTRHQSQANAKASGMRLNEIAAVYGHASDNTSTSHYARKSSGDKNMCKVAPTAVSLARVRNQQTTEALVVSAKSKQLVTK